MRRGHLIVTRDYLREHPECVFVFGDNKLRVGKGGAAELRDEPNTYGFITKKAPTHNDKDYYRLSEYKPVFKEELLKLIFQVKENPEKTFLVSRLGAGLANRYHIFEEVIEKELLASLALYENVEILF